MAVWANLNAFNAGELSPRMQGRNDVSQYGKGCQTLVNFMVTPYGAVERRPGTKFITKAKYADRAVRLIRFAFSSEVAYVCEFGDKYIRFIKDGAVLKNGSTVVELSSPYSAKELADLKFVQCADVMTLVHPDHPVYELKRIRTAEFTLTQKYFEYPPMLDPNLNDNLTLTPSGVSGTVTLTASGAVFASGNVGGYFELVHTRRTNEISIDFKADGTSGSLEVYGYWTFTTHGTWTGVVTLQRSYDGGSTWGDYRTWSSAKDSNTSDSGEETGDGVLYRVKMSDYEQSGTGTLQLCRCLLVNPDFTRTGVVKITAVESATKATGTVVKRLGGTGATTEWLEGAFSDRRGYPRAVAYFEDRMVFGGTNTKPQTIWGSKTGDWDNYLLGTGEDAAWEFKLASDTVNTICWLCQHDALIIGTSDSEWILGANRDSSVTASAFRTKRTSVYGAAGIAALLVGEVVLFVQQGRRKVREYVYSWEKEGYNAPDMTVLADHISRGSIKETALQQLPDTIFWCVLDSGTIAALTYEREQEVVGWQRITTNGKILSCCVIPAGDENKVYWAVERNGVRCIEEMQSRNFESIVKCFYVDSGVTVTGSGLTEIGGLGHLEGMTVQVLADGAVQREKVVENGKIRLDQPANRVTAGLSYTSEMSPMPIEIDAGNGSSSLRRKSIGELRIRVYDSVGGQAKTGSGDWQTIISRDVLGDNLDRAIGEKTEVVRLNMLGGYEEATDIRIRQKEPLPLNVTAIAVNFEIHE